MPAGDAPPLPCPSASRPSRRTGTAARPLVDSADAALYRRRPRAATAWSLAGSEAAPAPPQEAAPTASCWRAAGRGAWESGELPGLGRHVLGLEREEERRPVVLLLDLLLRLGQGLLAAAEGRRAGPGIEPAHQDAGLGDGRRGLGLGLDPLRRALVRITSVSVISRSWSRSATRSSRRRLSSSAFLSRVPEPLGSTVPWPPSRRALSATPGEAGEGRGAVGLRRRQLPEALRPDRRSRGPGPCRAAKASAWTRWRLGLLEDVGGLRPAPPLCGRPPRPAAPRSDPRGRRDWTLAEAQAAKARGGSRARTRENRGTTAGSLPRGLEASPRSDRERYFSFSRETGTALRPKVTTRYETTLRSVARSRAAAAAGVSSASPGLARPPRPAWRLCR